jgi:hypothetical protein
LLSGVILSSTAFTHVQIACHSIVTAAGEACSASVSRDAAVARDYSAILAISFGSAFAESIVTGLPLLVCCLGQSKSDLQREFGPSDLTAVAS